MELLIDRTRVTVLKNWFTAYVRTFRFNDIVLQRNINLKKGHTRRVCIEIVNLGEQLGLNEDEIRLAEIIALFHDIGRFEQFARYRTFNDNISEDHAELGISILKKYGILDNFDHSIRDLILCPIKYHNKPDLPVDETEQCIFFYKLIRDADKLDILKVVSDNYNRKLSLKNGAVELGLPDTPGISEEVYRSIMNKSIVNITKLKNLNDFKLLQAGWIFDINFTPTMTIIKDRNYMEKLYGVLPKSKEIDEIFDLIKITMEA